MHSTTWSSPKVPVSTMKGITSPDSVQNLQRPQVVEAGERIVGQDDIRHFAEPLGVVRFGLHPLAVGVKAEAR